MSTSPTTPFGVSVSEVPTEVPASEVPPNKNQILLAAAEACLDSGWAIIPLSPNSKEPYSVQLNPQGYVRRIHNGIRSVISASYGPPRKYLTKTGTEKLTTAALQAWWDGLECNVGVALFLSDLTVLDIDEGIDSEDELLDFLKDFEIPITRCIKSGRVSSFGAHLYYKGKMASGSFSIPWRGKKVSGEIKSEHKYVAAEGSFHKSGQQYRRLWDMPLTETPRDLFTTLLKNHPMTKVKPITSTPVVTFDGDAVTPEQFEAFAEKHGEDYVYAGIYKPRNAAMYLRTEGCPWKEKHQSESHDETDFAILVPLGGGPLSAICFHEHCKDAWTEASGWKSYRAWLKKEKGKDIPLQNYGRAFVSEIVPLGKVVLPNGQSDSEAVMSESQIIPEPQKLVYPDVWKGTLYGDYADLCTAGNYIPREFFIESLKTTIGAIVGKNLEITNVDGGTARFYTMLIGLPSSGKNTSINWTTTLFDKDRNQDLEVKNPSLYRLRWHPQESPSTPELGVCETQVSSASGLAKFLSKGSQQERLLFKYTELASFLEKCGIDGSGLALVSAICDLYDGTEFSIPALSEQKPFGGSLQLSILAGIQPERWSELGSGKGIEHSGIHSRWNLIPNEEKRTVSTLTRPDFTEIEMKLREKLSKASPLLADAGAKDAMAAWYDTLAKKGHTARLNILAWRNALHHAWLVDKTAVDAESVNVGTKLADYQLLARERYTPLVGDSSFDKAINAIRRVLSVNGAMTESQLKRKVHYTRLNQMYEKARNFLYRMGEIAITNGEVSPTALLKENV